MGYIYSNNVYMNESWPTMTSAMIPPHKRPDEVSSADLNSLLRGRKFGKDATQLQPVAIPEYNPDDIQELEEFCHRRGIVGINFNGMNPKAVLQMLKGRLGIQEQPVKKGILHG